MAPTQKYAAIIAGIDLDMIYHAVMTQSKYGAPESLNHSATITTYLIRFVERIQTVKDLVRRLKNDIAFKMDCGFRVDDPVSSEATFSRYDSFETKYETLKYTQPKECKNCPLVNEGVCQKVWKIKITKDLRRHTASVRDSKAWKTIIKLRTSVERVNAYLKEYFQLNNVRYRTGKRAKVHFDTVALIYNASKLGADRINAQLNTQNVS